MAMTQQRRGGLQPIARQTKHLDVASLRLELGKATTASKYYSASIIVVQSRAARWRRF